MLRVSERTERIEHVPRILYHWRKLPRSIASSTDAKDGISELQAAAVDRHLERLRDPGDRAAEPELPAPRDRGPEAARATGRASRVIVPTKDAPQHLERCLDSIFARSTYPDFEVILVDNGTTDPTPCGCSSAHPVDVLPFDGRVQLLAGEQPRRRARRRRVRRLPEQRHRGADARLARGDGRASPSATASARSGRCSSTRTEPSSTPASCSGCAARPTTSCVASRATSTGTPARSRCTREVSAVTARLHGDPPRRCFEELGGFDEHYGTHYQDVDLCLRLARVGPAEPLHAAGRGPSRRERHARVATTTTSTARSSSTRGARRSSAATRTTTPRSRSRAPTTEPGRSVNVVFVNYHDFTSNSAVHICNLADELVAAGDSLRGRRARRRRDGRARSAHQPFQALDFRDGARRGLQFPDGSAADARPRLDAARERARADRGARRSLRLPVRRAPRGQRGCDHRRAPRPDGRRSSCRRNGDYDAVDRGRRCRIHGGCGASSPARPGSR